MPIGSEELNQSSNHQAKKAPTNATTAQKRKLQNRAAQKTYREKRKRKLQELEELTARSGPANRSTNGNTSLELVTSQGSDTLPPPDSDTSNTVENPDWLFDFIAPTAIDLTSPSITTMPHATVVTYQMCFPDLPTEQQRAALACKVFAAYTRTRTQHLFDPYQNNLNISTLSFAAGFFANALSLGLTDHMYCNPSAQSNFYRPKITESPYADTMMLAVQRSFDGLKPDLRPTSAQIVQSHHPAIDFFPFPNFRRRLIEGLAQNPPLINEVEFWEDLKADAIVCWGSASVDLGGEGVPWSWEAKEWFLDKYRGMLGDEEDELWRASRWWREMRGEYT
ncbi:uncharacterized protein N0V89_000960 [Didymosphaeria variabile]|uniref:BZIP domain-containing protein n=1 Tax=Didymosphaeria variabile TaxID=1932322 RepID=A0A9W8XW70_9PLEO|nr:uncharacterized protein N0V89_000960 [Didymosphaeria variabile]KAJ4360398.1 hypothetical protein N0V89_000960 [Didymosphaeria variabile]